MKKGKCRNYNFCSLSLENKVINIEANRKSLCLECQAPLFIIEKEVKKKQKFRRFKFLFKGAKREAICNNDKNCNLALKDKVIKIYDIEDVNCRECNRPLNIRPVTQKKRNFNIINFKFLFFLLIFIIVYFFIILDSLDIIELKSKVEFLKNYHDKLINFLGEILEPYLR